MTRLMKTAATLAILTSLTACDYAAKNDLRQERENGTYQTAMADYKAGRVEQAVAGFEKVIREDPANASARFQLACLQQDLRHDYVGAFCNYREYTMQHPESDKTGTARERLAICERELASRLAEKYGLNQGAAQAKEAAVARDELKRSEQARAKLEKDLAAAVQKISALEEDRKRLVKLMKTDDAKESETPSAPAVQTVKDLLEEDEEDGDRIQMSKDVAALRLEEKEESELASSLLPEQPAKAKEKRDAAKEKRDAAAAEKKEPLHEKRPETYVVQPGETLSGIALRFYGRKSAWQKIRDANKAIISTDGRVRVGDTIKLPE